MAESTFQLLEPLTDREYEILLAMANGMSNQEIANSLHIALATVKWYNTQLYTKLNVSNRNDAIRQARVLGLLDRESPSSPDVPHNLPQQMTPFIGRYQELDELENLVNDPSIRLLTILAPGGMGKTRLSLQLAQQQLGNFADGVFFVGLAPLPTHKMVFHAIAEIFELFSYDNTVDLEQSILNYLHSKQMLLILDNFEHLLEAAPVLSDILQAAPNVKILVSSRERLNLQGETVFTLGGMAFPRSAAEHLQEYDSIRLFVNGTQRVRPDYDVKENDLAHIIEICRLVDGMPLGIELASGWMDVMSPEKIANEIRAGIDILETDMRDIPERHRSIRATMNRSWSSLSENEQEIMMRLAIFRGGFRQEAAEKIAGVNIRTLKRLVNKALLYIDPFGRYSIHQLLSQYCQEKLAQTGQHQQAIENHAIYYSGYLAQSYEKLLKFEGLIYQEVEAEWDNILMAWASMVEGEQFELLSTCIHPIFQYMNVKGRNFEAVDLFQSAINVLHPRMNEYPNGIQIYGELTIYSIALLQGLIDFAESHRQAQELVALLEPFGDSEILADAYSVLTQSSFQVDEANNNISQLFEKAQKIYQKEKCFLKQADSLHFYAAYNYYVGKHELAWQTMGQAISLIEEHHLSDYLRASQLKTTIEMYIDSQRYDEAEVYLDEMLFIFERAEWVFGIAGVYRIKLNIALARNELEDAKRYCAAIIRWHQTDAKDWQMIGALWGAYARYLLMELGEDARATEIFSFVVHHPVSVESYIHSVKFLLEIVQARMAADVYEAAYERGKTMNLKQIVADAMAFLTV